MIGLQQQHVRIINYDERLTVTRDREVEIINGKPVRLSAGTFNILVNVQPVDGRDLLLVPEFDRFKEQYWLFTETPLAVNDRVSRLDSNYQVQSVQYWGSFVEARMMRIDVGPEATP